MHMTASKPERGAPAVVAPVADVLREQVAHEPVRVIDQDPAGTGAGRALDRGIRFVGHETAEPRIFDRVCRIDRVGLVFMRDPCHAFHVDRDIDVHRLPLPQ